MSPPKAVRPALQRLLDRSTSLNILRACHDHREGFESNHSAIVPHAFLTEERSQHTSKKDLDAILEPAVIKRQIYPGDITRYEVLERESNVIAAKSHITLLVDSLEHRHNVELWLLLLQFRKRLDGIKGIALIWHGLRAREVDIPTEGSAADAFWKSFILLCPLHKGSTGAVIEYATSLLLRTGRYYDKLYEEITAYWLRVNPKLAVKWHKSLYRRFPPPHGVLNRLCTVATTSKAALEAFRFIYASTHERNIYNNLISSLCASGDYATAQRWHVFLVSHGDIPSSDFKELTYYDKLQQLIRGASRARTATCRAQKGGFAVSSENQIVGSDEQAYFTANNGQSKSMSTSLSGKLKSYGFGDYLSAKPGILDDKICARMISTTAFSLRLIIEFFAGLGLKELGPVAFRELAIRVVSPAAIARAIETLNIAGIEVAENVFSKVMRYFIEKKESELLSNMLHSDLHPDAYGDAEVQQRLLIWYMKKKMWIEVNRTLEVITYEHPTAKSSAWNTLLQYFMRSSTKWRWIKYMDNMKICRTAIDSRSIKCLFNHRMASRQASKRISTHSDTPYDNISLYANVCLEKWDADENLTLHTFHEIMKRLGMAGRMDELAFLTIRLVLTFVSRYICHKNGLLVNKKTTLALDALKLSDTAKSGLSAGISKAFRDTFDESLVDAFISWGFINGFKDHKEGYERVLEQSLRLSSLARFHKIKKWAAEKDDRPSSHCSAIEAASRLPAWTKGIQLVSQLKSLGITINPNVVIKSIRHRLWTIYGPALSSRPRNRILKRLHRLTLLETVVLINQAWESPLFNLEEFIQVNVKSTLSSREKDDAVHDIDTNDSGSISKGAKIIASETHDAKSATFSRERFVSVAVRREQFLVYMFGENRYISKSEKRAVNIRKWAQLLEQSSETEWIGF